MGYNTYWSEPTWMIGVLLTVFLAVMSFNGHGKTSRDIKVKLEEENYPITRSNPIKIIADNSADGIKAEYGYLVEKLGPIGSWKIINRNIIRESGRTIEHFIISKSGSRVEIYFDISSFIDKNERLSDALSSEFSRIDSLEVDILLLPHDAFELKRMFDEIDQTKNIKSIITDDDIRLVRRAFSHGWRRHNKNEVIIRLSLGLASKIAVLMKILVDKTDNIGTQEWMLNVQSAISYAAKTNQQLSKMR